MFGGAELRTFIEQAAWVAVNDYEWGLLQQKTGLSAAEVAARVQGTDHHAGRRRVGDLHRRADVAIPCGRPGAVVDPTGCGDAYRAGLIHGLLHGLDWETTGRMASLMGAIKIESRGPQNHRIHPR